MEAFKTIIWVINIFSALAIIVLVLMQHGKGADAGASFGGSGSAQGVFGSAGNANFLTRMTSIFAMVFFATCLGLGYIHTNNAKKGGLDFSNIQQSAPGQTASAPMQNAAPTIASAAENTVASAPISASETATASAPIMASEPVKTAASEAVQASEPTKPVKKKSRKTHK